MNSFEKVTKEPKFKEKPAEESTLDHILARLGSQKTLNTMQDPSMIKLFLLIQWSVKKVHKYVWLNHLEIGCRTPKLVSRKLTLILSSSSVKDILIFIENPLQDTLLWETSLRTPFLQHIGPLWSIQPPHIDTSPCFTLNPTGTHYWIKTLKSWCLLKPFNLRAMDHGVRMI